MALARNPELAAANSRVEAARALVAPAGSRPDPMLMAGIVNVPVNTLSLSEHDMTMKMIGVRQTLPYPGKLRLSRRIAEIAADEQAIIADSVRLAVIRDVKLTYYEIAYIDAALRVASQIDSLAANVVQAADLRYAAGRGSQQDLLRATLEASLLNERASDLRERRRAAIAMLGSLIADTAPVITTADIPARLTSAAVDPNPSTIRFVSSDLGAAVETGPLPPLAELQLLAVESSPTVRRRALMGAGAAVELELARRQHLPDFDIALEYGQRSGTSPASHGATVQRTDMISFVISLPIAMQRRSRQGALTAAARADLASAISERSAAEALIRSEVARLNSEASGARTRLALYVKALAPQARSSLASAVTAYQSGTGEMTSVLEARRALLELEVGYHRSMSDFAQRIAELDSLVGRETLR